MKETGIVIIMISVSSIVFAQQHADRPAMADKLTGKMKSELALSGEQETKIGEINKKYASRQAQLFADSTKTRDDRRIERKRMQDDRSAEIKSVLTEEQFLKWTANKEKHSTHGKRTASAKDEMQQLKAILELKDDQYKKLIAINMRMAGQMKAMRSDTTVSRMDFREHVKQIKVEKNAAIMKLLTKSQYEKYVAYQKEKLDNRRRSGGEGGRPKRG